MTEIGSAYHGVGGKMLQTIFRVSKWEVTFHPRTNQARCRSRPCSLSQTAIEEGQGNESGQAEMSTPCHQIFTLCVTYDTKNEKQRTQIILQRRNDKQNVQWRCTINVHMSRSLHHSLVLLCTEACGATNHCGCQNLHKIQIKLKNNVIVILPKW